MNTSNKVIVKNSLYLYIRTFISIIVSLYTSRIFLEAIGVEGFGIYNLVGGIVAFFALLQSLMAGATQRFLNIEIGRKNNAQENKILDISIVINIVIAMTILLLGETLGLWLIHNKLNLPEGKESIAVMVYHISLLTTMLSVLRVPYSAYIVAHERMSFFAYISLVEVVLKLGITIILFEFQERLVPYSMMLFAMNAVVLWGYRFYCKNSIGLPKFKLYHWQGNPEYKSLLSFSGWTVVGNGATVARDQGIAIIINMFLGVTLNAAIGVMTQVSNIYSSLFQNLQTAFMPQIVQNSASDIIRFKMLIRYCTLFTLVLMGLICVPMIAHADFILHAWLGKNVPKYADVFIQIIMVKILLVSTSQAIYHALVAIGRIKEIQLFTCLLSTVSIVATYIFLYFGMHPAISIAAITVMDLVMLFIRLYYIVYYTQIKVRGLLTLLWKPYVAVFTIVIPMAILIADKHEGWIHFILTTVVIELAYVVILYMTIDIGTRTIIIRKIRQIIKQ